VEIGHSLKRSSRIFVGRHSYGVENMRIVSNNEGADLHIGSFCSIAANQVVFLGGNHRTDWITTYPFGHIAQNKFPNGFVNGLEGHPVTKGDVTIGDDVWIGENCAILSGVTIGAGSVIAAGSVVTKNTAPYTISGGNPAKEVKQRFSQEIIQCMLRLQWWNYPDDCINLVVPLLQSEPSIATLKHIESILLSCVTLAPIRE
jgi:acetyltransferase-like isoleucine patch superfamily enzyme